MKKKTEEKRKGNEPIDRSKLWLTPLTQKLSDLLQRLQNPLESQVQFDLENGGTRILDFVDWAIATGYEAKVGFQQ